MSTRCISLNEYHPEQRDFAAAQGVSKKEALEKIMEVKSVEFVKQGAEVYHKA